MKHAAKCMARMIDAIVGCGAAAPKKLLWGLDPCVLGIDFALSDRGFQCRPAKEKVRSWMQSIDRALSTGRLTAGEASKLSGKLSWGCSSMFNRLGRAMLRPLFDQKRSSRARVCTELNRALVWWKTTLTLDIAELRPWQGSRASRAHLFCDAAGNPAHLGAVLLIDRDCFWTHMAVPENILSFFKARKDNQIMGLELLSISLGLSSFEQLLRKRRVVIHSDNTGSEAATKKGTARSWDHAQLVHAQWLHAAMLGIDMHVVRVPTDDNIADLPSRMVSRLCNCVTSSHEMSLVFSFLCDRSLKYWKARGQHSCRRAWITCTPMLARGKSCRSGGPSIDSLVTTRKEENEHEAALQVRAGACVIECYVLR